MSALLLIPTDELARSQLTQHHRCNCKRKVKVERTATIDGIVAAEAAPMRGNDGDDGQAETDDAETFGTSRNFEIASIHLIIVAIKIGTSLITGNPP